MSIIEFTQFQLWILKNWMYVGNVIDNTDDIEDTSDAVTPFTEVFDLPRDEHVIPKSSIITNFGTMTEKEAKMSENFDASPAMQKIMRRKVLTVIKELFDKYILYGSKLSFFLFSHVLFVCLFVKWI